MKEKLSFTATLIFCILGGGVLFFIFMKYIFASLLPFLIAWAVAFAVRRPSAWIGRKTKIPIKVIRVILSTLLVILTIALGCGLIWQLVALVWRFLQNVGEQGGFSSFIEALTSFRLGIFKGDNVPEELRERIAEAFQNAVNSLLATLGGVITEWVSIVPKIVISIVIAVIATIYFSLDLEGINSSIQKLLPEKIFSWLVKTKNSFLSVGLKYIRSYSLIMLITFVLMTVGFLILRVKNAPLIAVVIAVLDILPILGVGTVLVPWSVFAFITGNTGLGIGLLLLLVINEVTRQFAEPKIIGKNLNIHPLLTLVLLYSGYYLLGFAGLILLPLAAVLINLAIVKDEPSEVG